MINRIGKATALVLAMTAATAAFAAADYWYPLNAGGTWDTTTANWSTTGNNAGTAAVWVSGSTAVFGTTTDGGVDAYPITLAVSGLTAANLNFNTSGFQLVNSAPQTLTLSINNSTGGAPTAGNTAVWVAAGKTAYVGTNVTLACSAGSYGSRLGLDSGATLRIEAGGRIDKSAGGGRDLVFGSVSGTTTVDIYGSITRSVASDTASISFGNNAGTMNVNVKSGGVISTAGTGAANTLGSIVVGHTSGATGIMTMDPGSTVTASSTGAATSGLKLGVPGATGTLNLNGGVLTVNKVFTAGTAATLHFNGGTLKANAAHTTFINGLTTADVQTGGGTIDNGGFNIAIPQVLTTGATPDGGLAFTGTGTTTLQGLNTYTGPTKVLGSKLNLNTASGSPLAGGALSVSNATLTVDASAGTALSVGNVSLQGSNVLNFVPFPSPDTVLTCINASGSLSNSGTNYVNVTGSLAVGVYHLFSTAGAASTNNFVLASLPPGIKGVLTNSTSTSLDLFVYFVGQTLDWHGANFDNSVALPNWDVATSTNWYDVAFILQPYKQYAGNAYGDVVTFGNNGFNTDGTNSVNLAGRVVPSSVTVNSATPYRLTGTGGIDGSTFLLMTNASSFYLGTSNSYSGGTIIAGGTLIITNDNALGAGTAPVTMAAGTLQLDASVTGARAFNVTGTASINTPAATSSTLNGGGSGTGELSKLAGGTLTLGGNLSVGQFNLNDGIGNVTGTLVAVGGGNRIRVGYTAGNGTLNIPSGGTVIANNSLVPGSDTSTGTINVNGGTLVHQGGLNIYVGSGSGGSTGILNLNSGTISNLAGGVIIGEGGTSVGSYNQYNGTAYLGGDITLGQSATANQFNISGGTASAANLFIGSGNGTGTATLSGGTLSIGALVRVAAGTGTASTGTGLLTVTNSAVLNVESDLVLGYQGAGNLGRMVIDGGTVNVATTTTRWLIVGQNATSSGQLDMNNGQLNLNANTSLKFSTAGTATLSTNVVNLNGGNITLFSDNATTVGGSGLVDLAQSGGAAALNTFNLNGGVLTTPRVGSSSTTPTRLFNFNGGTLKAAASSATFMQGLSAATVQAGGAIIDSTNFNISIAQALVDGGTGGGLTKKGSGILTLTGANTYAGNTVVNGGTLLVAPGHLATNGVSVANGCAYGVALPGTPGTVTNGTVTLAAGATTLGFAMGANGNTTDPLLVAGALINNGTLSVTLSGSASKFSVGVFPLVKYGAGSVIGTLNTVIAGPHGMSITLSNSVADSTLYAVVNSLGSGIVWSGTNSADPATTNLWDLNTTANWLVGATPVTYEQVIIPGDAVTFNDAGSGLVLLSNTASPASVTINNNAIAYDIQGTGQINSSFGLIKAGTGTVTLGVPGTYSDSTVVSNGTINLAANQNFANLAGAGALGVASGTPTLTLPSTTNTTFAGSISGPMSLTKTGTGILTLSAANNTYSGTTTIATGAGAGVIRAAATQTLGSGLIQFDTTGNGTTARLELSGGISLPNAIALTGRNNSSVAIENISGNNTLTGTISVGVGGGTYLLQSDAGLLTLGTPISTAIQATSGTRTVTLQGIGDGNVAGAILDGGGIVGVVKDGSGTWTLSGINLYTGTTTVTNGTLLVDGSIAAASAVTVNGGTLGGTGTIGGTLAVNSGGKLSPGDSIGTLTVNGNITLNTGSTNVFEVNGSTLAKDVVAAGGTVAYGGVLEVVPAGAFTAGQTFQLFSGAGATSATSFTAISGSPGSGLGFTFTNGVLSVVSLSAGPAGPAHLTNSVSGSALSLSWPAGQGWRLQAQTNSLNVGLATNWTYITDGSISSTNIAVDPTKPAVFYRLKYP